MEFTLLAAAAFAAGTAWVWLRFVAKHGVEKSFATSLFDPGLTAIGVGLLGGRLASMLITGTNPLTHVGDILIVRGGVHTGFATLAALIYWTVTNRRGWLASDVIAVAALSGLATWHTGCLLRRACAGTASDLPWAIELQNGLVGRHPVELYAGLAMLIAAVVLSRTVPGTGLVAGIALAVASLIRLVTEPLRPSISGGPIGWYVSGALVGIAIAAWRLRATGRTTDEVSRLHSDP